MVVLVGVVAGADCWSGVDWVLAIEEFEWQTQAGFMPLHSPWRSFVLVDREVGS